MMNRPSPRVLMAVLGILGTAGLLHSQHVDTASSTTSILRHIVLFKLKDGIDKAATTSHICGLLRSIGPELPLLAFECGPDLGIPGASHDFALFADFDNEAAYKDYASNPKHLAIIETYIKPVVAQGGRAAVEIWTTR